MKKQNGFTLVEVLISLALVGVLSVVAIQTLRTRDMSEEFTAKRDKAAMNIEGVIHQAMFEQKREELGSVGDIQGFINEKLQAGSGNGYSLMRDGTAYSFSSNGDGDYAGELTLDVNGSIAPNVAGEDIYKYKINSRGNLILANNTESDNTPPADDTGNGGGSNSGGVDNEQPDNEGGNPDNNMPPPGVLPPISVGYESGTPEKVNEDNCNKKGGFFTYNSTGDAYCIIASVEGYDLSKEQIEELYGDWVFNPPENDK